MEIQFHPASGRGTVRTFAFGEGGERFLIFTVAVLVALVLSLWATVPLLAARQLREGEERRLAREFEKSRAEWNRAEQLARSLRQRVLDRGDLFNRIAFLYAIPALRWPRILSPQRAVLATEEPGRLGSMLGFYLRGLERGRVLLSEREREDPELSSRVPMLAPIAGALFEPAAYFGPRTSSWTGEEEFCLGVDLATRAGATVVASGSGVVVFAGTVRHTMTGSFWRLGNVVIVSHDPYGATVYGHLARIDVRRGQSVVRGERLGSVGSSGWAISPQLHYEYWRGRGERLRPTDPLFTTLGQRFDRPPLSLEQMEATTAPDPLDPIPGIQISAQQAAGARKPSSPAPGRRRSHRRRI